LEAQRLNKSPFPGSRISGILSADLLTDISKELAQTEQNKKGETLNDDKE
jgi:hypothetical protein